MREVKYSNQANTVFGRAKMTRTAIRKMVTVGCQTMLLGLEARNSQRTAKGTASLAQKLTKTVKKIASAPTMAVQPMNHQYEGFIFFSRVQFTKPLSKTSTKRQRRVDPSISVVDKIARGGKGNGHLRKSLQDGPHERANDQVCNDHIARSTYMESFSNTDEDATSDVGAERDDLRSTISSKQDGWLRSRPTWTCRCENDRSNSPFRAFWISAS